MSNQAMKDMSIVATKMKQLKAHLTYGGGSLESFTPEEAMRLIESYFKGGFGE